VAESSRVESREQASGLWLDARWSQSRFAVCRAALSLYVLVEGWEVLRFWLRMLVRRDERPVGARRRLLHGRHGGSLKQREALGWKHKPRRARSCWLPL
jgi:hypothetical protein